MNAATVDSIGGALHGLKIVDLSRVLAGPFCTMILADHGANVIKIEPPQGDDTRSWGPPFEEREEGELGDASYYLGLNRNKRAMSLDLAQPSGREVLLKLLEDADVLVENFKTGTMESWGLGYEQVLRSMFPKLVYCRVSGFGSEGPLGNLPGYDAILQAMTGLMAVNGDTSTGPMRMGIPVVDLATGLYSVIGILMALQERQRSDQGQFVDMTLYDCGMAMLHPHAANHFLDGKRPSLLGNSHPNIVPCDKFKAVGGEIFIAVGNERQFFKLVEILGRPELAADERFSTNRARSNNRDALTSILASCFAERDALETSIQLLRAGVPIGPVMPIDASIQAEHTVVRNMVIEQEGYRGIGTPIKLSRTPGALRRRPPSFGEHNREVLVEHGLTGSAVDSLESEGVVPCSRRS